MIFKLIFFFIKIRKLKNLEPFLDKVFQFLLDAIEPKDKELDMDPTLIRARTESIHFDWRIKNHKKFFFTTRIFFILDSRRRIILFLILIHFDSLSNRTNRNDLF